LKKKASQVVTSNSLFHLYLYFSNDVAEKKIQVDTPSWIHLSDESHPKEIICTTRIVSQSGKKNGTHRSQNDNPL
jgi:hypothetical protein